MDAELITPDRKHAFLLFATFCGDVEKTAYSLNMPAWQVLRMAEEEGWLKKLEPLIALQKSSKPGDFERGMDRAQRYVQALRARMFLERCMQRLINLTDPELHAYLEEVTKDKDGQTKVKLSTRALADFMSALEKCHAMAINALGDTAAERVKRNETSGPQGVTDLHAAIADAMTKAAASASPRALLFDAQLDQGNKLAEQARAIANRPENPHDNDDH